MLWTNPNHFFTLQRGGVGPLHLASRHGHTHLVRLLLDHGADVNLPSRGGSDVTRKYPEIFCQFSVTFKIKEQEFH